jgi:eukaryotic-like serine/threonine-protein kinase
VARVGPYEIGERIGRGGTAEVYAATGPDGDVAIKLLARGAQASESDMRRFEREARAAEALSHPHLIRVIAHGIDAELGPWLAMPLVRGMTLRDLFGGQKLAPEAAIVLVFPVVDALAAMHEAGLIHRDVKPENVMLSPLGDATLVDLGLAHFEGSTRQTAEGEIAGSIPYLSPERIEARDVAASADVWSIGVMLYELVRGRRPFERDRAGEEVAAIRASRRSARSIAASPSSLRRSSSAVSRLRLPIGFAMRASCSTSSIASRIVRPKKCAPSACLY